MADRTLVPIEQKTILFYDDEITAVRTKDGHILVPVRPIVERLGLNWSGQYSRMQRDPVLREEQSVCVIQTDQLGAREAICLPLDYLSGFLFGINADRVKPEYREDVIRYQRECYKVLSEALTEGRLIADVTFDDLLQAADPGAVQAYQIAQAVKAVAIELGKKSGRNEFGAIYGELYRKFGITSYKMLPARRFDEAMHFLTNWHESITGAVAPF